MTISLRRVSDWDSRINAAIDASALPPNPAGEMLALWSRVLVERWFGPIGEDPGGDPVVMDPEGRVLFAGRPIPAVIAGGLVHTGIPSRLGDCIAWGIEGCRRLIRARERDVHLVLGRTGGECPQTWSDYRDKAGRRLVLDLTLDDREPFDRDAYMAAGHMTYGSRFPVPDLDTLDEYAEIIQLGQLRGGYRARS
jgi:hypothetical protein